MKKVLVVVAAIAMVSAFTSCKKTCTCTESVTGVSQKMETNNAYPTCQAIEDLFEVAEIGTEQDWHCK